MAINPTPPIHGGNLQQAVTHYRIPRSDWLDLSTGIAPHGWPVPELPTDIWQRLPENDGELAAAAADYYGTAALAVPGSQWAIQQLPTLFAPTRVWMARESYEEYRYWWTLQGHQIQFFDALPDIGVLQPGDILVLINPNNPTADLYSTATLLSLALQLQKLGGWLIVDEAFADATPQTSLLPTLLTQDAELPLVVLRSLGKFFGLAGIRLGFVAGHRSIQTNLQQRLGPWAISHPTAWIGQQALLDTDWQVNQRSHLAQASARLSALLAPLFPRARLARTPLFVTLQPDMACVADWQDALARQGIWIRHFPQWNRLRFGLPPEQDWDRLAQALAAAARQLAT